MLMDEPRLRSILLEEAKSRALKYNIQNVVLPCVSGFTVKAAMKVFGPGYAYYAVGNPASSHARGLVYHAGTSAAERAHLEAVGVHVILQEVSPFQVNAKKGVGLDHWEAFGRAYEKRSGHRLEGELVAQLCNNMLTYLFSDGPRVCIEIALMAADAGVLPVDEDCISLATPSRYCDLPDAAVIMRPAKTADFFGGGHPFTEGVMIKDVLLVPSPGDWWMKS